MFRYETHLHTFPVSKCAKVGVEESLIAYKKLGHDGVFITNHFIDGNINVDASLSFADRLKFYLSDYEKGLEFGKEIGLKVFFGFETSYKGTDFLVYGLDPDWLFSNPQIEDMKKTEELQYFMDSGALVIQAHPYREANYIDHIRLFPRHVHGVEVVNACMDDFVNSMARHYAESYSLIEFAGTDNHRGGSKHRFAGMESETPIENELDFVSRVKEGKMKVFTYLRPDSVSLK
ncbi:MAG: histidinol-phosphatase [Clostridia bacterium]|nr:histidinol-phosphatase [Clostridia bacterium]